MQATEHRYTSFDGLSLYYRSYGEGEQVVLCLPGLTRNSNDFASIAHHLSDRYRVITPDLRGRGQSEADPRWKQYVPATYVRDAWDLLDHLGITRCAIIGTSLGGLMSMIMADQRPGRLSGIVLNDIGPAVAPPALARILEYAGRTPSQPDWASAIEAARKNYQVAYPRAVEEFWEQQARATWRERPDGRIEPAYDPAIGDAIRHSVTTARYKGWLKKVGFSRYRGLNIDPWDNFRAVTMPCLLLHGEISDVLTPEIVKQMKQEKPDLEVLTVTNTGHVPTLNEPEVIQAIDRFLNDSARP